MYKKKLGTRILSLLMSVSMVFGSVMPTAASDLDVGIVVEDQSSSITEEIVSDESESGSESGSLTESTAVDENTGGTSDTQGAELIEDTEVEVKPEDGNKGISTESENNSSEDVFVDSIEELETEQKETEKKVVNTLSLRNDQKGIFVILENNEVGFEEGISGKIDVISEKKNIESLNELQNNVGQGKKLESGLVFEVDLFDGNGNKLGKYSLTSVKLYTNEITRIKEGGYTLYQKYDGAWVTIPFSFCKDETGADYIDFKTSGFESPFFFVREEKGIEVESDEAEEETVESIESEEVSSEGSEETDSSENQETEESETNSVEAEEGSVEEEMLETTENVDEKESEVEETEETEITSESATTDVEETEVLEENSEVESEETEFSSESSVFTYEDDTVVVTATINKGVLFEINGEPVEVNSIDKEDLVFHAVKLSVDSKEYTNAVDIVKSSVDLKEDEILDFTPYDVYFEYKGERVEPESGNVSIEMTFKENEEEGNKDQALKEDEIKKVFAAHIKDNGEVECLQNEADDIGYIAFKVNSFSIMGKVVLSRSKSVSSLNEEGLSDDTGASVEPVIIDNFAVSFVSGADLVDENYVWSPTENDSGHIFVYRADYSMSGKFSSDIGAFKLEVPLHILKDRDDNWADKFDCPYVMESEITEDMDTPEFVYSIDEDRNIAIIYNYKPYETGKSGYIEFSYTTTEKTFSYVDMSQSTNVGASIFATNENSTVTASAEANSVYINTGATISYVEKRYPSYYETWQDSWGKKPEDADDYLYLVWTIKSVISKNTSSYDFFLNDTFSDLEGDVVGYRFSGDQEYSSTNCVTNCTGYGERYDYVLTKHKKDLALECILDKGTYTVNNKVEAIVSPIDHIDENTSATSSKSWFYKEPSYTIPTGHFNLYKFGMYSNGHVYSSNSISNYTLREFQENEVSDIEDLYFDVYGVGYPYPWTLADGATGTLEDAKNGKFGQKKVDYEIVDDTFYLEGSENLLSDDDYDIQSIKLFSNFLTAEFNNDNLEFESKDIDTFYQEDNITVYVRTKDGWNVTAVYDLNLKSYQSINSDYVSSESDKELHFKEGVKGVKVKYSNAYWYSFVKFYPYISLHDTNNVKSLIGKETGKDIVELTNVANYTVSQEDNVIFQKRREAQVYIKKVERDSEIKKDVIQTKNNKKDRRFEITWRVSAVERYTDNDGDSSIPQESGIFYDLLPGGSLVNKSSVKVELVNQDYYVNYKNNFKGAALASGEYEVETINNYNGTGRTLLVVEVKKSQDEGLMYQVTYTTIHTYDTISDYGKHLLNSLAYETGNDRITGGFPDNGGQITENELMSNLDPNTDELKFLYCEANYDIDILTASSTGLNKKIRNSDDINYYYDTVVHKGEQYNYHIRLKNTPKTSVKDIILFDSIESFYQNPEEQSPTIPSDWKGVLKSIDTAYLSSKGVDVKVYCSKFDDLNIQNHHDLSEEYNGELVWSPISDFLEDYELSQVTAVAVDISKNRDGTDFVLNEEDVAFFDLYMKAPNSDVSGKSDPIAYNNIYVSCTSITDEIHDPEGVNQFFHQDYTKAHYRMMVEKIKFLKVDSESKTPIEDITYGLQGVSDYGTVYDETRVSDKSGEFSFKNIEKGTYQLREVQCSEDWLLDTEVYTLVVDDFGNVSIQGIEKEDDTFILTDQKRIHGDLQFFKKDSITKSSVAGAHFRLSGVSDYGNIVIMTAVSEDGPANSTYKGRVQFNNLELGEYTLTETEPADGYIKNETVWTVKVDERGISSILLDNMEISQDSNYDYFIENEPYHTVSFVKTSSYGDNIYLEGAEFSLVGVSDYGSSVSMTATSASEEDGGLVQFTGLEPGTYLLKETKAPTDHDIDMESHEVKVRKDGTFTINGLEKTKFGSADIYEYKDRMTAGTFCVTKKWVDTKTNDERPVPDISIWSNKPSKSPLGFTVTYDANGGTFASGRKTNDVVYNKSKVIVSGNYSLPKKSDAVFKGWGEGEFEYKVSEDGIPEDELKMDMHIHASWATCVMGSDSDTFGMLHNSINRWGVEKVVFTDEKAPDGVPIYYGYDEDGDLGVIHWYEDSNKTMKISTQEPGVKIIINSMKDMFSGCTSLKTVDFSNLDASSVNDMSNMFYGCSSLTTVNLNVLNMNMVVNASSMFEGCSSLAELDMSNFTMSPEASYMFKDCSSLARLNMYKFDSSSGNIEGMFSGCSSLASVEFKTDSYGLNWNTKYLDDLFLNCNSLESVTLDLDEYSVNSSEVTSTASMFEGCSKLSSIDLTAVFGNNLMPANADSMFKGCTSLRNVNLGDSFGGNLSADYYGSSPVNNMFNGCSSLEAIDISLFNCRAGDNMFDGCNKLEAVKLNSGCVPVLPTPSASYIDGADGNWHVEVYSEYDEFGNYTGGTYNRLSMAPEDVENYFLNGYIKEATWIYASEALIGSRY